MPTTTITASAADRFCRTIQLIGEESFHTLQKSRVTIVGIGAVGSYVMEGLTRAGVGNLRLVDFDIIEASNINRQLLALTTNIGQVKVHEAARRISAINPDCEVEALEIFANADTLDRVLSPAPDLIIDAIDSLNPKVDLLEAAYLRKLKIISSMGAALRTDPGRIRYGDISQTQGCPLAKHVRRRLRRRNIDSGIPCVYSTEKVNFAYQQAEINQQGDMREPEHGRHRNVLGSLPTITGIFGLYIANQAIMSLCNTQQN